MTDWVLTIVIIDTTLTAFASIFAILTAYVFYPYYLAMWHYRRSGQMAKDATPEMVGFILSWADAPKKKTATHSWWKTLRGRF